MSLLNRAKCYLVGPMQYQNGRGWRERVTEQLKEIGVVCFDPYSKPFEADIKETEEFQKELLSFQISGDYDTVSRLMANVCYHDLALVTLSDFIIAYIDPKVVTVGSWHELFLAEELKKPIFLIVEGGKKTTPLWLFGTINHNFIFESFDQVIEELTKINFGKTSLSVRWKLLKQDIR